MATAAANPFDIQTGTATTNASGSPAAQTAALTPGTATAAAQFNPQTTAVDKATETTSGQLQGIMAEDSPLMQQARTQAQQGMASRGLLNSSMAQGAGVSAMLEKAIPIAASDASTFSQRTLANQNATNTAGQFNAASQNQFGLQTAQQDFSGAQLALDRAQQLAMSDKSIEAQSALQKAQQDFASTQAALDRANQAGLQTSQQQFQAESQARQNTATLEQIGFKSKVDLQNIPTAFAANIANTTMSGVNSIMADGTMNADAKKAAITNLITYANAQVDWANKFYSAAIPAITQPK